jgi:hypothetical protein
MKGASIDRGAGLSAIGWAHWPFRVGILLMNAAILEEFAIISGAGSPALWRTSAGWQHYGPFYDRSTPHQ